MDPNQLHLLMLAGPRSNYVLCGFNNNSTLAWRQLPYLTAVLQRPAQACVRICVDKRRGLMRLVEVLGFEDQGVRYAAMQDMMALKYRCGTIWDLWLARGFRAHSAAAGGAM